MQIVPPSSLLYPKAPKPIFLYRQCGNYLTAYTGQSFRFESLPQFIALGTFHLGNFLHCVQHPPLSSIHILSRTV
jgi:hypothetical protein